LKNNILEKSAIWFLILITVLAVTYVIFKNSPSVSREKHTQLDINRNYSEVIIKQVEKKDSSRLQLNSSTEVIRFEKLVVSAFKELPRKKDFEKSNNREVHETPETLLEKSQGLVNVAQELYDHPSLAKTAAGFYYKCSLDSEIVTPIRARCLASYKRLSLQSHESVDMTVYPLEIIKLSEFIP
jgi:hypothetical protein